MPELLTRASCRKDWKGISAESSLVSPRRPNRPRDWSELNSMHEMTEFEQDVGYDVLQANKMHCNQGRHWCYKGKERVNETCWHHSVDKQQQSDPSFFLFLRVFSTSLQITPLADIQLIQPTSGYTVPDNEAMVISANRRRKCYKRISVCLNIMPLSSSPPPPPRPIFLFSDLVFLLSINYRSFITGGAVAQVDKVNLTGEKDTHTHTHKMDLLIHCVSKMVSTCFIILYGIAWHYRNAVKCSAYRATFKRTAAL